MGVVYKLRKEIVEFIINEKKSNPDLGCRNLVGLVEAKFQTKISKSAINEVIKNAQLSSSIGRKSIVISHSKVSKALSFPNALVGNPDESILRPPTTTNGSPRHEGKTFGGDSLGISSHLHEPRIVEPSPLMEEKASLKFSKDKGVFCDGAGCFFLKAAQWELFHQPMLGKMVSQYISSELANDADSLMDVLLFLPMFGIQLPEIMAGAGARQFLEKLAGGNLGLWAIHGLTESMKPDRLLKLVKEVQDQKDLSLRLFNEISHIFLEAVYVKIVLEDQTELILDGQYRSLRSLKEKPVYYSLPIEKSLERLALGIISNGQPLILRNINDRDGFPDSIHQLMAAFENRPGKRMVKAAILDERGEEISKFTAIPSKKRFFIVGAEKNFVLPKDLPLRTIFVKQPDAQDQASGVILTNIPESVQSSSEVISEYLKEWPDFPLSFGGDRFGINSNIEDSAVDEDFYNATKISLNPEEIPDFWNNLGAILAGLNKYCQRHFFPKNYAQTDISVMKSRFYQLAGSLKKDSGGLEVSLILPEGYAYRGDLEQAVRTLNEFHVQNDAGQTVFLKIVP